MNMTPTDSSFEPSEAEWADIDKWHTCNAARDLVQKAVTAAQRVELTLAFGLKPEASELHAAEQESYALDHQATGACDWS